MSRGFVITQADTSTLGDASFSVGFVPQLSKGMPARMTGRTGLKPFLEFNYRGKGKRSIEKSTSARPA